MKNDLFCGTKTPRPPADLRARMMRAARTAGQERCETPPRSWGFTHLDLVWVAALLVLAVCNALLSPPARASAASSASPRAIAQERQLDDELGLKRSIVVAGRETRENVEGQRKLIQELEQL